MNNPQCVLCESLSNGFKIALKDGWQLAACEKCSNAYVIGARNGYAEGRERARQILRENNLPQHIIDLIK